MRPLSLDVHQNGLHSLLLFLHFTSEQTSVWGPNDETVVEPETLAETRVNQANVYQGPIYTPTLERTLKHVFLSKTVSTHLHATHTEID